MIHERGLESERGPETEGRQFVLSVVALEGRRGELKGEVGANIEDGELGIDIGIDHAKEINANEGENTHVAIAAETVFAVFENRFETLFIGFDVVGGRE